MCRKTGTDTSGKTGRQAGREVVRMTGRQDSRQADRQTGMQTGRQAGRQACRQGKAGRKRHSCKASWPQYTKVYAPGCHDYAFHWLLSSMCQDELDFLCPAETQQAVSGER